MTPDELKARTRAFALDTIRFTRTLPRDDASRVMGKQLVRCTTSVGANYRAACLAKSTADMVNKLKIVEEEADEACYWLGLLRDSQTAPAEKVNPLEDEAQNSFG